MNTATDLQDMTLTCRDCRAEYIFTAGEQQYYRSKKLKHIPSRCRECRKNSKAQLIPTQDVRRGTVKWFSAPRGYGFITIPNSDIEADIYVHFSQILSHGEVSLIEGQEVEFNLVHTKRGPAASHVRVIQEGQ